MQLLLHLPDDLAARFRASVPARKRSAYVAELLRRSLPERDDPLYRLALEVEQDQGLNAEMAEWDAVAGDGLEPDRAAR
jgi:hypothetical protein